MEIRHASLAQVHKGRNGRRILIETDVLDVVGELQKIDPNLRVYFNEFGNYYAIVEVLQDGSEGLVTTVPHDALNSALVDHIRMLGSGDYDYIGSAEKADKEAEKAKDYALEQEVGEMGERMAHVIRKDDVEYNGKAFIPKDLNASGNV
jgi:hypothetical protein